MWKGRSRAFSDIEAKSPRRHDDKFGRSPSLLAMTPKRRVALVLAVTLSTLYMLYTTLLAPHSRFVVILASNQGGGVMDWKGPQEWAIERASIKNKKDYTKRWGYGLAIKDVSMRKKYAHEWRESWEKVDIIKETMRENPHAEWFWWLDLSTYIMEPSISLEQHLFRNLESNVYRNLSTGFNPLNITDDLPHVSYDKEVNMIVPQDCGGFNLGSFFVRRSEWSERLLDLWWDPVFYEQKHMEWDHKEQDAFEMLYRSQSWIRSGTAFVGNRKINSFPPGACSEFANDRSFFYA